ncbi:hypothetical protein Q5P01_006657 [Channa striata]|uniref:Resistance to inhibitors of cholinesterase protein 3 N-terminal domain-containing protein n=1 Tax=Channa striata TaxID=64152 RepID=A0AA88SW95_CHASR|nr:hypothetical protein Q5P01_006657 [Channa striata]
MIGAYDTVGPGFYRPVVRQPLLPEDADRWGVDPSYSIIRSAEAMAKVKGIGHGKKYNLMAQVIPIYGFGILLYILYIIYKLTCKGRTTKSGNYITVTKANMENRITNDYELARLQERLLQTEQIMEMIVSGKGHGSGSGRRKKSKTTTSKNEEKLLRQLRQFTQLIQEGRLEAASPEMEAEEVPYGAEWEGYPDETYPDHDEPNDTSGFEPIMLEETPNQPTAEALAERMEQEEDEVMARKLSVVQEEDEEEGDEDDEDGVDDEDDEDVEEEEEDNYDVDAQVEETEDDVDDEEEVEEEKRQLLSPPSSQSETKHERVGLEVSKELQCHSGGKKQISFSEHKDVFHYPKQDAYEEDQEEREDEEEEEDEETEVEEEEDADEDDPVMEAESLQFSCEGCSNPEEEAEEDKEEYLLMSAAVEDDSHTEAETPKEVVVSGLRMRNRRET